MSDSFKIEDNYKEPKIAKRASNKKNNKVFSIICSILLLVCLIVAIIVFINYQNNKVNVVKKDSTKSYVYTVLTEDNPVEDDSYYEVPAINLVGSEYDRINSAILANYKSVSEKKDYDYSYKINVSGNTLSLLISYAYSNSNDINRYFESIVVDLNKNKILTKSEILKRFKVNEEQINIYLASKFKTLYTDIIKKGYYTSKECDYDCFLNNRKISSNYVDGITYCIEDGSLVAYKYFNFKSNYGEEDYFLESDYRFIIKK